MSKLTRTLPAAVIAALSLTASTGPASASVGIGQTDPSSPPMASCAGVNPQDMAQPTVTSGTPYVAPADGIITSWSHNAYNAASQHITMKVWRLVSGTTYRVVGHDGPRTLTGPGLLTFSGTSVPCKAVAGRDRFARGATAPNGTHRSSRS